MLLSTTDGENLLAHYASEVDTLVLAFATRQCCRLIILEISLLSYLSALVGVVPTLDVGSYGDRWIPRARKALI